MDDWSCLVKNLTSSVIFCNLSKFFFVSEFNLSLFKYLSIRDLRDVSINEQWLGDLSKISIVVVLIFVSWINRLEEVEIFDFFVVQTTRSCLEEEKKTN